MNIFIFHRDLRIIDNTTLIAQIRNEHSITPIFIFTPEQIEPKKNTYHSNNSVQFMIESLHELNNTITKYHGKMYFFHGHTIQILESIKNINSIGYNIDYTPYARKRDETINKWCEEKKIKCYAYEDYGLYNIIDGSTKNKKSNNAYLVYTPFKKFCLKNLKVRDVDKFNKYHFKIEPKLNDNHYHINVKDIDKYYYENNNINVRGGRSNGLKILSNIKKWTDYNKGRDYLTYKTTFLSAHNHFTTISIRETYHKILSTLGLKNNLINELHWREFYMNITYYFPHVLEGQIKTHNKPLKLKYNITWHTNKKFYDLWCQGKTGFPIVDAAMTQLNTTGYMHNRCRMIVASFLCKDLLLDWREGERYFASKLVDYDAMSNSGGWGWASSTGADSQPYFRIFNPWLQQVKFDKECEYIKKWLPSLKDIPNNEIHKWYDSKIHNKYTIYIKPIVNHDEQRPLALKLYKQVK